MKLSVESKQVSRMLYDDEQLNKSQFFLPKIWIDFFSKKRMFWLKTAIGDRIKVSECDLKKMKLKLTLHYDGPPGKGKYVRYMEINHPYRVRQAIPLYAISKKLNKIWRGTANVDREYEEREKRGYLYWCPRRG
jgi:hypothetical protein